jgi:AraC-like DNA-binding protein
MEFLVVSLSGSDAAQLTETRLGVSDAVLYPHNPEEIRRVMESMFEAAKTGSRISNELCRQYVPVLLLTVRRGLEPAGSPQSVKFQHYQRGKNFLDTHFTRLHSAYQAADAVGLSHAYFCRLFQEIAKVSPHQYLTRLKLNFAARILQTTSVTLEALADQLGYANPFVFSRAFKRHFGVSPQHYRQKSALR